MIKGACATCRQDVLKDDDYVTYTIVGTKRAGRPYEIHYVHGNCNRQVEINWTWEKARKYEMLQAGK